MNQALKQDSPAAPTASAHACDILIADDTGASRELLLSILRNFARGLDVREARNGTDALAMFKQLNPRLTILDIDMPGVDGLTVLQQIREVRADAFVAMVSGSSLLDNVRKALDLGAKGYVVKPYKPQRIVDLLSKYRDASGHDMLGASGPAAR